MRKAEDYIIEKETDHLADQYYSKSDIIGWIKQAQIDAIEEAVKRCAENAETMVINDTDPYCFDGDIVIDKQTILQVADKLKKELE